MSYMSLEILLPIGYTREGTLTWENARAMVSCLCWFLTRPNQAHESKGKRVGTFQNNEVPTQQRDRKIPGFADTYTQISWQKYPPHHDATEAEVPKER